MIRAIFTVLSCMLLGHRWGVVGKARVSMCLRCKRYYRLGKGGRALEEVTREGMRKDRKLLERMTQKVREFVWYSYE